MKPIRASWYEVSEWRFMKQRGANHTVLRQVVDNQADELDLIGVHRLSGQESSERLFSGLAVQSHQRADEEAKTGRFRFRKTTTRSRSTSDCISCDPIFQPSPT